MLWLQLRSTCFRRATLKDRKLPKTSYRSLSNGAARNQPKAALPERVLIYHAGTGRTVAVGFLKISTIYLCAFFCAVEAPRFYMNVDQPNWKAAVAVIAGVTPMLFVGRVSAPYVAYVHAKAPQSARMSKDALMRWAKTAPGNTELDLTTMRAYGLLRVSRLRLEDLQHVKAGWFNVANVERKPGSLCNKLPRRWWKPKPVHRFYIGPEQSKKRGTTVSQLLLGRLVE